MILTAKRENEATFPHTTQRGERCFRCPSVVLTDTAVIVVISYTHIVRVIRGENRIRCIAPSRYFQQSQVFLHPSIRSTPKR